MSQGWIFQRPLVLIALLSSVCSVIGGDDSTAVIRRSKRKPTPTERVTIDTTSTKKPRSLVEYPDLESLREPGGHRYPLDRDDYDAYENRYALDQGLTYNLAIQPYAGSPEQEEQLKKSYSYTEKKLINDFNKVEQQYQETYQCRTRQLIQIYSHNPAALHHYLDQEKLQLDRATENLASELEKQKKSLAQNYRTMKTSFKKMEAANREELDENCFIPTDPDFDNPSNVDESRVKFFCKACDSVVSIGHNETYAHKRKQKAADRKAAREAEATEQQESGSDS